MTASRATVLAALLIFGSAGPSAAQAPNLFRICSRYEIEKLNEKLGGTMVDYSGNHRVDHRLYSPALGEKRDLYVYLPPGYDCSRQYPLMIWLHGFGQDEKNFLDIVGYFDSAMRCGDMPKMIVAAPDGSIKGRPSFFNTGSFYINSDAGRFEDWIMSDVWNFLHATYPIMPGRDAHILAGASMGGYGAYYNGIKHRDRVGTVVGLLPPLNTRYIDCRGGYFGDFDPACFAYDDRLRPNQVVARFYTIYGIYIIRKRRLTDPLYGRGPDVVARIAADNPVEMIDRYNLKPGELQMYVGYGKRDEFNIDAQIESFLYVTNSRGIEVTAYVNPTGKHSTATGLTFLPTVNRWLKDRVPAVK